MTDETAGTNAIELATELTIAWLSNPNTRVDADQVPGFLQKMHEAVTALASTPSNSALRPILLKNSECEIFVRQVKGIESGLRHL